MPPLIETFELTKQFDTLLAVDHITFTVNEGEILALLGPNGAGKTTTVRMLSSILKPTHGTACIAGYDVVRDAQTVRHLIGHLTEFPGLYLRMRPLEYLDFFGELHHMPREVCRARAEELMRRFDLWDARTRRLGEFSKGMRQKMALVRAMLHSPRVLFLDEPTSAMDPHSAKQVRDAIASLRGSGHTIVLCTHNLYEAEALADHIAIIRRGRLIAFGKPEELKHQLLGPPVWQVSLAKPCPAVWHALDGRVQIVTANDTSMQYQTENPTVTNPWLLQRLQEIGAAVVELRPVPRSLEEVYLKLVQ